MSSHNIALITDSGCDLPDEILEKHGIGMVPLYIIWGKEELRDRLDLTARDFYQRLPTDPIHPTTSQPHQQDFLKAINGAAQTGAQQALIITISSGMSSTYHSALQAAQSAAIPTQVYDSKANSLSQGFEVLAAARVREAGGTAQDMLDAAEMVRRKLITILHVDTLTYLHRGGRIGRAAKWVGVALDLKPQLRVNHDSGAIEPGPPSRTRKQALERLYRTFFGQLKDGQCLHVGIVHGDTLADADVLAERIHSEYHPVELLINMTSPMMGIHTGPGALALCGYTET